MIKYLSSADQSIIEHFVLSFNFKISSMIHNYDSTPRQGVLHKLLNDPLFKLLGVFDHNELVMIVGHEPNSTIFADGLLISRLLSRPGYGNLFVEQVLPFIEELAHARVIFFTVNATNKKVLASFKRGLAGTSKQADVGHGMIDWQLNSGPIMFRHVSQYVFFKSNQAS